MEDIFTTLLLEQQELNQRIFNIVLGRVIKKIYVALPEDKRKEMEQTFLSNDDTKKNKFLETHVANCKELFGEELDAVKKEIELELKK